MINIIGSIMWVGTCDGSPALIVTSYNIYGQLYVFEEEWKKQAESLIDCNDFKKEIREYNLIPGYKR